MINKENRINCQQTIININLLKEGQSSNERTKTRSTMKDLYQKYRVLLKKEKAELNMEYQKQ